MKMIKSIIFFGLFIALVQGGSYYDCQKHCFPLCLLTSRLHPEMTAGGRDIKTSCKERCSEQCRFGSFLGSYSESSESHFKPRRKNNWYESPLAEYLSSDDNSRGFYRHIRYSSSSVSDRENIHFSNCPIRKTLPNSNPGIKIPCPTRRQNIDVKIHPGLVKKPKLHLHSDSSESHSIDVACPSMRRQDIYMRPASSIKPKISYKYGDNDSNYSSDSSESISWSFD